MSDDSTRNGTAKPDKGERPVAAENGKESQAAAGPAANASQVSPSMDPETRHKLAAMRTRMREAFGGIVMAMMLLPRYRHLALYDLQHAVFDPLVHDRIALAHPSDREGRPLKDLIGAAIWASVSEEVDKKIREQIVHGVFPIRLKPNEWRSGEIHWLLDVIAPDQKTTAAVIASLRQAIKSKELKVHPVIVRLLDKQTLRELGIQRREGQNTADASGESQKAPKSAHTTSGLSENRNNTGEFGGLDQFDFSTSEKNKPQ